jgi:hypothetical protein
VVSKLFYYAAFFELSSIGVLFIQSSSLALLLSYFLLHAAGSALLSLALSFIVPARYRKPRHWLLGYLFAFNFFIPLAGLICAVFAILLGAWMPRMKTEDRFGKTEQPRFTTHRNHEGTGFRGGQVRAQLGNAGTPLDLRMKALVAVQDAPARASGDLLRTLLADPADDVRLLAYGILDGKEKGISQRILALEQELDKETRAARRRPLHKQLAELHWELMFQNLVQGDMLDFSADQVRRHAEAALREGDDAGLWFMVARLELRAHRTAEAEHAIGQARRLGFAGERLLPYLAELRFQQRRYDEVRRLFAALGEQRAIPALAQARAYWLRRPGTPSMEPAP